MSENLRRRRKRLGLTQVELAEILGYNPATVSRWERGTTPALPVVLLALDRLDQVLVVYADAGA